jgi:DNA repair exonuclease SbcCD nuclease subunit
MEIMYVTDLHFSGKNPICRLDNLVEVQFDKFRDLIAISNKNEMPIVCGGDVFESPNVSYSIFTRVANILKKCKYGFYTIYGNHDLQFHTMDSSKSVALGALIESVSKVKHMNQFYNDYNIHFDYEDWNDNKNIINAYSNFLLCHKAVINPNMMNREWMKHNTIDFYILNNLPTDYDLILCGHYHKQYEVFNKTIFKTKGVLNHQQVLNPGCFTRRNANNIEIHRPSYYIVNIKTLEYSLHELPNTKDFNEVISNTHLTYTKMMKNIKGEISDFFEKIKGMKSSNQFFKNLMEIYNKMEGETKESMRGILVKVYGEKIERSGIDGFRRIKKTKRKTLQN